MATAITIFSSIRPSPEASTSIHMWSTASLVDLYDPVWIPLRRKTQLTGSTFDEKPSHQRHTLDLYTYKSGCTY